MVSANITCSNSSLACMINCSPKSMSTIHPAKLSIGISKSNIKAGEVRPASWPSSVRKNLPIASGGIGVSLPALLPNADIDPPTSASTGSSPFSKENFKPNKGVYWRLMGSPSTGA